MEVVSLQQLELPVTGLSTGRPSRFSRLGKDPLLIHLGKPQLTPELDQFAESFKNDSDFRPCRAPEAPREMTHFDFLEAHTKFLCLGQNFGVHHRANRSDLNAFEYFPPKHFVRAIDITNLDPKQDTHKQLPPQRIDVAGEADHAVWRDIRQQCQTALRTR